MPTPTPPRPPHASPPDQPVDLLGSHSQSGADDALPTENVLWTAEFAPVTAWALAVQWALAGAFFVLLFGIIPIILVPCVSVPLLLGVLALGWFGVLALAKKYVASLRCVLTTRSVRASGGVLFKWERSIPLDKITDVTMSQGPIARMFEVEHLAVETAGGGAGPGKSAAIPLFGVVNPREFRRAVLEQRDRVVGTAESPTPRGAPMAPPAAPIAGGDGVRDVLLEIRDELRALRADRERDRNAG